VSCSPWISRCAVLFCNFCCSVGTLNKWAFHKLVTTFEKNKGSCSSLHLREDVMKEIRSNCAHFHSPADADAFVDLVSRLSKGPEPPQKAVDFAEHLVETHSFFSPLRLQPAPTNTLELRSLAELMGGVHTSEHSRFQRLIAQLLRTDLSAVDLRDVLENISGDVMLSSAVVLSEKIRYGAVDVLVEVLRARGGDFEIMCKVLRIAFEIIIFCPNDQHILMHFTHQLEHVGNRTGNFLSHLVDFACYAPPDLNGADVSHMRASALECISQILTCSIPYRSLSDFPIATNSCYFSPKMQSLLTGNVLRSILIALNYPGISRFTGDDAHVVEAFADDDFFAEAHRRALRDRIRCSEGGSIRWNETVEAWVRLL
jgi:hypothetical protein